MNFSLKSIRIGVHIHVPINFRFRARRGIYLILFRKSYHIAIAHWNINECKYYY